MNNTSIKPLYTVLGDTFIGYTLEDTFYTLEEARKCYMETIEENRCEYVYLYQEDILLESFTYEGAFEF